MRDASVENEKRKDYSWHVDHMVALQQYGLGD